MATDCIAQVTFEFQGLRPPVVARFDQAHASSDGGAVLLKALDDRLGLTRRLAAGLTDRRQPGKVQHALLELVQQRVFGIACGYADCNDSARLAEDPVHKLLLERDPDVVVAAEEAVERAAIEREDARGRLDDDGGGGRLARGIGQLADQAARADGGDQRAVELDVAQAVRHVDEVRRRLALAGEDGARRLVAPGAERQQLAHPILGEARRQAPGGRLLAVIPNRRGIWARTDTTPFGHGRPYSRSQITALLRETWFTPTGWSEALYVPPIARTWFLRSAVAWERTGATISAPFAGVHIVEATKQVYRAIPARRERRRLMPALEPALAPSPGGAARSG